MPCLRTVPAPSGGTDLMAAVAYAELPASLVPEYLYECEEHGHLNVSPKPLKRCLVHGCDSTLKRVGRGARS